MSASRCSSPGWRAPLPGGVSGCGRSSRRTCRTTPRSPPMAARSAAPRHCRRGPAAPRRSVDMNPVLLKPQSEGAAQIVLHGRVRGSAAARDYRTLAPSLLPRGAGRLRAARRRRRSGPRGGGRQPGRDQPARRRHRQYGVRRGRRCAGRADRRHRARRRDRPAGRHARAAVAGRAGAACRLYRQQVPRRRPAVRRRRRGDRRAHRAGAASESCRISPMPRCCPPRIRWRCLRPIRRLRAAVPALRRGRGGGGRTPVKIAVPVLPRIANFDDLDPLRAEPGDRPRDGPAGPSAAARRRAW